MSNKHLGQTCTWWIGMNGGKRLCRRKRHHKGPHHIFAYSEGRGALVMLEVRPR